MPEQFGSRIAAGDRRSRRVGEPKCAAFWGFRSCSRRAVPAWYDGLSEVTDSGSHAFLGRIAAEKGPERAVEIATRAGMTLKIAAKVAKADRAYWEAVVEPLVASHSNVELIGEIDEHQKAKFLGDAAALLFPINWPEPFSC